MEFINPGVSQVVDNHSRVIDNYSVKSSSYLLFHFVFRAKGQTPDPSYHISNQN
jgi:hypothetical protein